MFITNTLLFFSLSLSSFSLCAVYTTVCSRSSPSSPSSPTLQTQLHRMSLPPGLTITPKKETPKTTVLQDVCRSLAAMEQYLQSGCKKDEDSAFEYKDGNGDIQGPFNCTQLEEWNNAVRSCAPDSMMSAPPYGMY